MGSIGDVSGYANLQCAAAEAVAVQLKAGSCQKLQPAALCLCLAQRRGAWDSSVLCGVV